MIPKDNGTSGGALAADAARRRYPKPPACHDAGWPGYGRPQISGGRVPSAGWDNRACIGVQLDPSLTRRADGEAPPPIVGSGRGGVVVGGVAACAPAASQTRFDSVKLAAMRACTVCAHPARVEVDAALVAGTSYRHVATWHGLKMSAVFRHRRAHLAEPIRVRPCSGCGGPLDGASSRCAACRTAAGAQQQRRALQRRQRRAVDKAWLLTADARWSSDPELRRQRQAAGLCVVCAHDRPADRHWCCSREHEKLRQHTLHRVLNE